MNLSHRPRLSIGLPVYNGEAFLAQAIDALLRQTFRDFQLIVSDNASTDRTEEICRGFAQRDARVAYHRADRNHGAVWNFNHVVDLAASDYFKWATHDDVCAPTMLERCVEVLDQRPNVVLCYSRSQIIDARGEVLSDYDNRVQATAPTPYERFRDVITHIRLCHMLFGVLRLGVLRQTGLHAPYPKGDITLLGELALRGELFEIAEALFYRRDHPQRPTRAHTSPAELAAWFRPDRPRAFRFLRWTRLVDHLRTIERAPIAFDQRARCASFMIAHALRRTWMRMQAA